MAVYVGSHAPMGSDAFDPKLALATLRQHSAQLDQDIVLLVTCTTLAAPTALLETHPTLPHSRALMVTLVPRFRLPTDTAQPEVVFLVDRSGSMTPRVAPLKSSLAVFLKSLPLGVPFNICSFGSSCSFLWAQSRPYSDRSLADAQRHVDGMSANFGGTEILPPIRATLANRHRDRMLEIMLLTDGQVWNSAELFECVERETAHGDVRLFSLGIGHDVSHALVDGLARVGKGFSQVITHEQEGMESKVARMLRGALSAHVNDYRLEWEGKPSTDAATTARPPRAHPVPLFDPNADPDAASSFSDSDPPLPDLVLPSVLQAPHKLQPLFPFSRSTAYAILSADAAPPSHVWLRATTPTGTPLELQIPVQVLPDAGQTLHQLAARKILQELEDGVGYLHHAGRKPAGTSSSRPAHPAATFERCVRREGVRVGLTYGIASKWTSFLAVVLQDTTTTTTTAAAASTTQTPASEARAGSPAEDDSFEMIDSDDDEWTDVPRPGESSNSSPGS